MVHRSDKSGTTQNFVSYFKDVTPDNWTYDLSENWPNEVGQGAKGTSGVISTVKQADGTIGYADFSQVGDLGTVAVKVGDKYNEISAEAGSKVIGDSKQDDTVKGDNRIVTRPTTPPRPRAPTRSSWSPTTSSARPTRTPSRLSSPRLARPT